MNQLSLASDSTTSEDSSELTISIASSSSSLSWSLISSLNSSKRPFSFSSLEYITARVLISLCSKSNFAFSSGIDEMYALW